jgi:hypothetical protein
VSFGFTKPSGSVGSQKAIVVSLGLKTFYKKYKTEQLK